MEAFILWLSARILECSKILYNFVQTHVTVFQYAFHPIEIPYTSSLPIDYVTGINWVVSLHQISWIDLFRRLVEWNRALLIRFWKRTLELPPTLLHLCLKGLREKVESASRIRVKPQFPEMIYKSYFDDHRRPLIAFRIQVSKVFRGIDYHFASRPFEIVRRFCIFLRLVNEARFDAEESERIFSNISLVFQQSTVYTEL